MSIPLKQSTAVTIALGPFVDAVDGDTAETALTLTQADFRLSKNGAAFAQKNEATSGTHMENGYYSMLLDATDTNTLGRLRVHVKESGALPVWEEFMIMPANVWDSLYGADKLDVSLVEWLGVAPNVLVSGRPDVSVGAMAANVMTAAASAADLGTEFATAIWANATRLLTAGTNIVLAKGSGITGFNDLSAAQVNAEVVDAINVDTYTEPGQGAPPATLSLVDRWRYIYKDWRNKKTQTPTTYNLFNDAGAVVDQKRTVSDDGTTSTKEEIGAGP